MAETLLFWVITQQIVEFSYGRFGKTYGSRLHVSGIQKDFVFLLLKMGPLVYFETSVRNYHYTLHNNPAECSFHLFRGGSLKSSTQVSYFVIHVMNT
jgi:hypothetical protein